MIAGLQAKLLGGGLLVLGIILGALKLLALGKSSAINEMAVKTGEKRAKIQRDVAQTIIDGVQDEHEINTRPAANPAARRNRWE